MKTWDAALILACLIPIGWHILNRGMNTKKPKKSRFRLLKERLDCIEKQFWE